MILKRKLRQGTLVYLLDNKEITRSKYLEIRELYGGSENNEVSEDNPSRKRPLGQLSHSEDNLNDDEGETTSFESLGMGAKDIIDLAVMKAEDVENLGSSEVERSLFTAERGAQLSHSEKLLCLNERLAQNFTYYMKLFYRSDKTFELYPNPGPIEPNPYPTFDYPNHQLIGGNPTESDTENFNLTLETCHKLYETLYPIPDIIEPHSKNVMTKETDPLCTKIYFMGDYHSSLHSLIKCINDLHEKNILDCPIGNAHYWLQTKRNCSATKHRTSTHRYRLLKHRIR